MAIEPHSELGARLRVRVALVMGPVIPEQLALWHEVNQSHDIQITILGTDANPYVGKLPWQPRRPMGIDCVLLRLVSPAYRRGQVWWTYSGLGQALRRLRPGLVHVVSEPWGGLAIQTLLLRERMGGTPVCLHGADNIYGHGSRAERWARRLILSRVWPRIDGFASWSSGGIEAARGAGLPPIPMTVAPAIVPDPTLFAVVDSHLQRQLRLQFDLPLDEPILGYVGRLAEEKGLPDLLKALRLLGRSSPFFAVWGTGPLVPTVRNWLSSGQIRGRYGGALSPVDVVRAFQCCDIVVVPSRTTNSWSEQFGRVVVEAMLVQAAVVAYASGAIPEVLGDSGLLVDEGNVNSLAEAIKLLVDQPDVRASLSQRGRERALKRFHPRVIADKLATFWSEVLTR